MHAGAESDPHHNADSHTYPNINPYSNTYANANAIPHTNPYANRTGDSSGSNTVRRGLAAAQ